jgi:sarcosine oxidase subunit alpha
VAPAPGTSAEGYVTSAYLSPTLGRSIALALVKGGRQRHGQRLFVPSATGATAVEVTGPVFHDAEGKRLHG